MSSPAKKRKVVSIKEALVLAGVLWLITISQAYMVQIWSSQKDILTVLIATLGSVLTVAILLWWLLNNEGTQKVVLGILGQGDT